MEVGFIMKKSGGGDENVYLFIIGEMLTVYLLFMNRNRIIL